jgi:hypothetical protein
MQPSDFVLAADFHLAEVELTEFTIIEDSVMGYNWNSTMG